MRSKKPLVPSSVASKAVAMIMMWPRMPARSAGGWRGPAWLAAWPSAGEWSTDCQSQGGWCLWLQWEVGGGCSGRVGGTTGTASAGSQRRGRQTPAPGRPLVGLLLAAGWAAWLLAGFLVGVESKAQSAHTRIFFCCCDV